MRKQILFNFSIGQWAVSLVNSNEIIHSSVNFPHLEKFVWFEIVKENFTVLKEFFENLIKPSASVSSVEAIHSTPSSMFSARLGVNLTPIAELWKSSLLLSCCDCKIQQLKCPCLVSEVKCESTNPERHSRKCMDCNEDMEGAHVLELDFFDAENNSIKVDFTSELMDCFLSDFSSQSILSKLKYTDFLLTLSWHVERAAIGRPFIQNIVLKKITSPRGDRYIFISGQLQPTANGDRCVNLIQIWLFYEQC